MQSDVSPSVIMTRVEAASGAKYSSHKETARRFEPITPVGTSYTPVGKVDIAALRKTPSAPNPSAAVKPPAPTAPRPAFGAPRPAVGTPSAASLYGRSAAAQNAPEDAWPEEKPAAATPPPAPPAASRPPVLPSAPRPTFSAMVIIEALMSPVD